MLPKFNQGNKKIFLKEIGVKKRWLISLSIAVLAMVWLMPTITLAEKIELKGGTAAYLFRGLPLTELAKQYEQVHPEVKVNLIPFPEEWSMTVKKLQMEALRETSSYDFITASAAFLDVATCAQLGILEPLDTLIPQEAKDDMLPSIYEEMQIEGEIWAFPMVVDVVGLIYRPSMLNSAGYSEPPKTWNKTLELCEKLDQLSTDPKIYPIGFDWYWRPWSGYIPILQTYTEKPFESGRTNTWSPAARQTLQLMKQLYPFMPAAAADNLGASKAFQMGTVAMEVFWQTQMLRAIQAGQPAEDIEMTSLPMGIRKATVFWSTGYMVLKHGKHKQEVVNFLAEALRSRFFYAGAIADWKLMPFKSAYKQMKHELLDFYPPLISSLETGEAKPMPNSGYMMAAELDIMREELTKLMRGKQDIWQTMDNMTDRITEAIQKMGQ